MFTHFAVADEADSADVDTKKQFELFLSTVAAVEERIGRRTAAPLRQHRRRCAVIRKRIWTRWHAQDCCCTATASLPKDFGLRPAMALKAMINTIKIYDEGTDISYGRLFTTSAPDAHRRHPQRLCSTASSAACPNRCSIMTADGPRTPARQDLHGPMSMIDLASCPMSASGTRSQIFGHGYRSTLVKLAEPFRMSDLYAVSSAFRAFISPKTAARSTVN